MAKSTNLKISKKNEVTQVNLKFSPRELLTEVRDLILYFKDMNPSLPANVARKLQKNLQIQELNANAYVDKERALVKEYIVTRDGSPVWWNQKSTEKIYEDITADDGSVTKRLAGGMFGVKGTDAGMILVNEDGEQYIPAQGEKMKYLQKDIEKEAEYTQKMTALQNEEIEVTVILFKEEDFYIKTSDGLIPLNVPSDTKFLNIFVDGVK